MRPSMSHPRKSPAGASSRPRALRAAALGAALCLPVSALAADPPRGAAVATSANNAWELSYSSELRYYSWSGTRGYPVETAPAVRGSGWQLFLPVGLRLIGKPNDDWKLDVRLRSGWVTSQQNTPGNAGSVSTLTDTSLGGTITYFGINGIHPFYSLNLNLPTGKPLLLFSQRFARMDKDLIDVPSFGEGFNVGNTLGVDFAFSKDTILTFALGHTWRGPYRRSDALSVIESFNPSDLWSATTTFTTKVDKWTFTGTALASYSTAATINDILAFRPGRRIGLNGSANYQWDSQHDTTLFLSWQRTFKDDVTSPFLIGLFHEPFNSNSDVFKANLDHFFKLDQNWSFKAGLGYLYRDRNSYDPTNLTFIPAKTRLGASAGVNYNLSKSVGFTAKVEHFRTREFANPAFVLPTLRHSGWQLALGVNGSF